MFSVTDAALLHLISSYSRDCLSGLFLGLVYSVLIACAFVLCLQGAETIHQERHRDTAAESEVAAGDHCLSTQVQRHVDFVSHAYPHRYSATWLLCLVPLRTGTAPHGFCVSFLSTQVQRHLAFVSHFYPHRYSATWILSHAYLAFVSHAYPHTHTGTVPCGLCLMPIWPLYLMPIDTGTVPRGFCVGG